VSLSLIVAVVVRLRREVRRREQFALVIRDSEQAIKRLNEGLEGARAVGARLSAARPFPSLVLAVQESLLTDADPHLTGMLIEILLENAWKFSFNASAPRVDVGATETNGELVFFVRDTGTGFDMAHAAKLFTPFGRLHTVGEFPGIGIGLAIAQRIARRS
jgi:light-regulated signal transduction histidine kinase (bacteriophytochrome)